MEIYRDEMLEMSKKNMYSKNQVGKCLNQEGVLLQESDLKGACLLMWSITMTGMTEKTNTISLDLCLIVIPTKKQAPAWPQLETRKRK